MSCYQSSNLHCDIDLCEACIRALKDEERVRDSDFDSALCQGAEEALHILSTHQFKYPDEFMVIFRLLAFGEHTSTKKKPTDKE